VSQQQVPLSQAFAQSLAVVQLTPPPLGELSSPEEPGDESSPPPLLLLLLLLFSEPELFPRLPEELPGAVASRPPPTG
jgi:hypothetical protein